MSPILIYQTYCYDREANLLYSPTLEAACDTLTGKHFGFKKIIEVYSETIFPILPVWLHIRENEWMYSDKNKNQFATWEETGWDHLGKHLVFSWESQQDVSVETFLDEVLINIRQDLKEQVDKWLSSIRTKFLQQNEEAYTTETWEAEVSVIAQNLEKTHNINKKNAVYYFNGHKTVEKVIIPFALEVVNRLGPSKVFENIKTVFSMGFEKENPFTEKIKEKLRADFNKEKANL